MAIKIIPFLIILTVLIVSCKNPNKENELPNSERKEIVRKEKQETKIENTKIDTIKIIDQLQGKWKENVNLTVKFVEEGTVNKPKFEKFEVSEDCKFDNNNINDLKSSDVILALPESKRCEKLKVYNDTLTLSGFSTNNNEDYKIIYLKLKL